MDIGFIGTGTIAEAMVHGIEARWPERKLIVSPRSDTISRALAERYPNVERAASNAEAAKADMVILGMRPTQVDEALAGIMFRSDQIVVSLVAGMPLADVQRLAPRSRVDRAVPMPGIARLEGPITVYPGVPEVTELLAPLGDLVVAPTEPALNMGGLTGFMSSYFELQAVLVGRATAAGVPIADARRYVTSLFSMLAATAEQSPADRFDALVEEHQTKGGLNERVRATLLSEGWFERPGMAFNTIARLGRDKLG